MEIQSEKIKSLLAKYFSSELEYRLDEYVHDEDSAEDLKVMGELEYIKRECAWCIEDFEDPNHACGQDYQNALELKRKTKNFKAYPQNVQECDFFNFKFLTKEDIKLLDAEYDKAKEQIQEVKNLKKLLTALNKL